MSFIFQKQTIISIETKKSSETAGHNDSFLPKHSDSEEDLNATALSARRIQNEPENSNNESMDATNKKNKKILKILSPKYTETKNADVNFFWYEKIEQELSNEWSNEFAITSKKKSVVEFRLKNSPLINKTFRKRLIGKTYHTWLRPSSKHTALKNSSKLDNLKERQLTEKFLLYGKFKATPDKRPSQCPLKFIQIVTHLDSGARIFPNRNITPNKQKKCVCEFFTIRKSPLLHQNDNLIK